MPTITVNQGAVSFNQKSLSKASRTNFTPGKATGNPLDMNFPKDFEILTGNPIVDALIENNQFVQSVQTDSDACLISNPTINPPVVSGSDIVTQARIISIVEDVSSTTTVTPTTTQKNNGGQERNGGYNGFVRYICNAPTFSPVTGSYVGTQHVTISTTTFESTIKYTLDGSAPTQTHGSVYTVPVAIAVSGTLKAVAFKNGFQTSGVSSAVYTIS